MIGGYAQVRGTLVDHLHHGIEHPGNRSESSLLPRGEATQSIEMAEELVGSVDQMNDHDVSFDVRSREDSGIEDVFIDSSHS